MSFFVYFGFTGFSAQIHNRILRVSSAAAFPLLSEIFRFSSCLFKAPVLNTKSALIGQPTHAWASTANNYRAAVLNQFLGVAMHNIIMCDILM